MGLGYFLIQQTSPLLALVRGLRFEASEAVALLVNQGAILVDIRDQAAYAQEHIKGAESCPLAGKLPRKIRDKTHIIYNCDGQLTYKEISQVKAMGSNNLIILSGGIQAWKAAGFPIKTRSK